jgi:hypothetical protein
MMQLGLLGDLAIDFTQGTGASGRAKDGEMFAGERTPDLGEAAAKMLEVIKPVAAEATTTMKDLQQTAQNLNRLTDENSELTLALGQFKTFGQHLVDLTAPESALSHSLANIEKISTSLTDNDNIEVTLRNLRNSSEKLKVATTELEPTCIENIKQFSETIKTQPWRLIWPTTKKYAEASPTPAVAGQRTSTVRKPREQNHTHALRPLSGRANARVERASRVLVIASLRSRTLLHNEDHRQLFAPQRMGEHAGQLACYKYQCEIPRSARDDTQRESASYGP